MCACNPSDLNITVPSGPSFGIPGFGKPLAIDLPKNLFPEGFPEDLLEIFDKLSLLLPSGILKPNLNIKFQKDIFDGILNLLNKFFPFLLLYKFFLPVLNLIVCIIEVLCAFPRPFKMRKAVKKLFRNCLPDFLRMFPIFALIAMIMSLLYLLLQIINYIIQKIKNLIEALRKNIEMLKKAFTDGNAQSIRAAINKISSLLCLFQQLLIILAIFNFIFSAIKEILAISFKIPPCKSGQTSDASECCTTDVCPAFILNGDYTRMSGTFQYVSPVKVAAPPPFNGLFDQVQRNSSYSFFDSTQAQEEKFSNIYDAFDVTVLPKPIFFPTDKVYSSGSDIRQVPYLVDIEIPYDPQDYNRTNLSRDGYARKIFFKNCVVTQTPTANLISQNNTTFIIPNGVISIAGGQGFETDGVTPLMGYDILNSSRTGTQATLETFLFLPATIVVSPADLNTAQYAPITHDNVVYTFKINEDVLTEQNVVILNCDRDFDLEKTILFSNLFDNIGPKLAMVNDVLANTANSSDGIGFVGIDGVTLPQGQNRFPDLSAAVNFFQVSIANLRDNFNDDTLTDFDNNTSAYLNNMIGSTNNAINELIGIAFDPNNSDFTLDPDIQFTTDTIKVSVILKDSNNVNILNGLDTTTASSIALRLSADASLGEVSSFTFDGSQSFVADLSSDNDGDGYLSMKFDNTYFIDFIIPEDPEILPSSKVKAIPYTFIKTSVKPGDSSEVRRDDQDVGQV